MKRYVLDASAVLCGKDALTADEIYVPLSVIEELGKGKYRRKVEVLIGIKVSVVSPAEESKGRIRQGAEETGDLLRLSEADIDVLALALEIGGVILTDDYSIQNVAKHLGIEYEAVAERGIKEEFHWEYVCTGCRRRYPDAIKECPVCGAVVRTKRKKKGNGKRREEDSTQ
ncbi:MAG: hypothetical protein N3F63_06330 [Thermoplasmata archaeon]|nr:hypothetical protein [Thermoplasmata archaeon]